MIVSRNLGQVARAISPREPGYALAMRNAFTHEFAVLPLPKPPPKSCIFAVEEWKRSWIEPSSYLNTLRVNTLSSSVLDKAQLLRSLLPTVYEHGLDHRCPEDNQHA